MARPVKRAVEPKAAIQREDVAQVGRAEAGAPANAAVVVIGRNEGERLMRCLRSVRDQTEHMVYVDSGSTDASVKRARALGIAVAELPPTDGFTAAAGRNLGFRTLLQRLPGVDYIQFVDGDMELQTGWLRTAASFLDASSDVAIVCGHTRERTRNASPYHRLMDIQWESPVGDTESCGGAAMIRVRPLIAAHGFDPRLISGEEAELSYRLRARGYRIVKIDHEMALHDCAIRDGRAWWRRSVRTGHAYAELAYLNGTSAGLSAMRRLVAAIAWGGAVPVAALGPAWLTSGWSLCLGGLYPLHWLRIYATERLQRGRVRADAALYATACVVGKFSELQGIVRFSWNRLLRHQPTRLIEYKGVERGSDSLCRNQDQSDPTCPA